jgi:hypothetical protein
MCIERLKILDRVAYIRFASVYRDFQDVDSFTREVEALTDPDSAESKSQLRLIEDDVPRLAQRGPPPESQAGIAASHSGLIGGSYSRTPRTGNQ